MRNDDRMVANNLEPHYLTHPGEVIKEDKHKLGAELMEEVRGKM